MCYLLTGQYLVKEIAAREDVELAFVWNRSPAPLEGNVPQSLILQHLDDFEK